MYLYLSLLYLATFIVNHWAYAYNIAGSFFEM